MFFLKFTLSGNINLAIDSVEKYNFETQMLFLRNASSYKEDICSESDRYGMQKYFTNYTSNEMRSFFENPSSLDQSKAIDILKDYKKGYDDRTAYIKRQPSNMGFAQLAHYENIGYLIWLASSSALIVNSLFEKGVKLWRALVPAIDEEMSFYYDDIPKPFLDYIKINKSPENTRANYHERLYSDLSE